MGTSLLMHGAGALLGIQIYGPAASAAPGRAGRCGRHCAALAVPLDAPSTVVLASGLLLFGVATGVTDVAMNARAVTVERPMGSGQWAVGKPIMSSTRCSIGDVEGSLAGAAPLAAR